MFKISSFENDIFHSMESTLVKNQVENKYGFNKLIKATDYLNKAADIFEQTGMTKEADDIVKILQSLAKDLND